MSLSRVIKITCAALLFLGTRIDGVIAAKNELAVAPIVGLTHNAQVNISIQGVSSGNVRIEYRQSGSSRTAISDWQTLDHSKNFTTDFTLNEMKPNTSYDYRLLFESGSQSQWFRFRTFPPQGMPGKFNFVFSACAREREKPHRVFGRIARLSPTFFALLGDNMYADYDGDVNTAPTSDILHLFREKYRNNFDEPFQKMSSTVPVMAIWDDHDYGQDNSDGDYPYKRVARDVLLETFPDYPYEVDDGGLYFRFTLADVDIFALDTRWYRSPMQDQDRMGKTMLGAEQLKWLLSGLRASKATFKIVFSSVSLNDYGGDTSSGRSGYDSWMGYRFERDSLLSVIEQDEIRGVMVFSGDQHYPSAHILNWKTPLSPVAETDTSVVYSLQDLGTSVFDFSASPLNYKRAAGVPLIADRQVDPRYSFEIFRAEWGKPEHKTPDVVTSVYGFAEIDTQSPRKKVTVRFFELSPTSGTMYELYRIVVASD
ncbi:alkaline phosphatase D family protein [bacterium]|nr:alkaline phosphatase D family protein [bacterium]